MQCFKNSNGKVKHELSVHRRPNYDDIKHKTYAKASDLIIDIGYCLQTKKK